MITRNENIVDRRKQGLSLQDIADEFGMTRERVRQILVQSAPELTVKEVRRIQSSQEKQDIASRRRNFAEIFQSRWPEFQSMSVSEISTLLGVPKAEIVAFSPNLILQVLKGNEEIDRAKYFKFSESECLDAIVKAATMHYPLRMKEYVNLVSSGVIDGPSVPLLFKRFGSWTKACEAANVEFVPALRDYDRVWSEQDLSNFVYEFAKVRKGEKDAWNDFCEWLELKGDGYPSSATIRNRLGLWRDIRSAAYSRLILEEGLEVIQW